MTSDWRGEARNTIPNLSMSYREAALCIISTAQHARPNVIGQSDPLRAQFTKSSTRLTVYSTPLSVGEPESIGSMESTLVSVLLHAAR
eukprot:CAMPEP_0182491424 /NCGR_PEP_ID=MMETSP1321-20130603/877_1 /TAXON_ID=91990 /ORGANISM="Bolidomonas sp., Strain RCC1657" /LENGTH=87 /DNA_ID=CAMNT_0024693705 /DNA_START=416 /DNA_END=679 /DNA_ORIENTATION=-